MPVLVETGDITVSPRSRSRMVITQVMTQKCWVHEKGKLDFSKMRITISLVF